MSGNHKVGRCPDWPMVKQVDVIYGPDESDIMVVNKPPGCDVFQTHYHFAGYPQLRDVVQEHYPNFAHAHRIDRTTSGCFVFGTKGKNGKGSISLLKKEWTKGVTKTYLAVVGTEQKGRDRRLPKWDEVILTMRVRHTNGTNEPCTTTLTNLGGGVIAAELTKGGRNHQIRRALHAIGWPILGDSKYGGAPGYRVMLHAWLWEFRDIKVQAQLPPDMAQWEPGGYNEPLSSFPMYPLSVRDMERLDDFRQANPGGTLGWPLPAEEHIGSCRTFYAEGVCTCGIGTTDRRRDVCRP